MSIEQYVGFWTLDTKRSDDYADVLSAQSISWLVKKVILNMTITYDITVSTNESGVQVLHAINPKGTKQDLIVDGAAHADDDATFGAIEHTATVDANGNFHLVTVSEKYKWKNTGTWVIEGNTMVRTMVFESPKLNKTFKMTFVKKE
ncbi:hypothetical protein HDU87_006943 [Geranomyces variabilis]|uniref:Uncharacterized protein n=1 Tax=Geranomyces variabilis TaxID=109894 RepID=A0AAD5XN35_9FUNG|nr:hypothetical protein HDU87_006943 [Geranomyces variabilis]